MNKIILTLTAVFFSFAAYKFNELYTPPPLPVLELDTYWGPGSPVPDDKSIRPFKIVFKDEMGKLIWIVAAVIAAFAAYKLNNCCKPPALPVVNLDQYWGPGSPVPDDKTIKPFKVLFKDDVIADLKERLTKHRPFTPPLEGIGFEYGFNTNYLNKVVAFWKDQYDFKAREKFLNKFPQFVTKIQGLDIHFLHVKPEKVSSSVRVLPLLLLHGWPGSVREFYEMIPLLTTPQQGRDFVFEIIAPSLPGYGFSQGASKPGLGVMEVAVIFRNLMTRLGFPKFVIQGGDWGSAIGCHLSTLFQKDVVGYHTNMPMPFLQTSTLKWLVGAWFPSLVVEEKYADRMYPVSEKLSTLVEEMGYMHLQASKPDTIGVALNDSPVGLAAYILEKFSTWTNDANKKAADGNLTARFKLESLIDNLMIYWTTGSITTSMRLYAESINKRYSTEVKLDSIPTEVPTAIISFKHELTFRPSNFFTVKFPNLVQHTIEDHTGHFPALESPEVLAKNLIAATEKFIQFSRKEVI